MSYPEDYDGHDARLCPACGTKFDPEADPCLAAALDRAEKAESEAERRRAFIDDLVIEIEHHGERADWRSILKLARAEFAWEAVREEATR